MSDDILFLIGFLFVVLLAFTFSHSNPKQQANSGVFLSASSTVVSRPRSTTNQTPKTPAVAEIKAPALSSFSQNYGPVGMTATLRGKNFAVSNNAIHFGATIIYANSADGKTLTFKVPSLPAQPCPNGAQSCFISNQDMQTSIGTYQVYVSNAYGKSNTLSFKVGNYSSNYGIKKPQIVSVTGPKQILPNDPAVWALTLSVSKPTTLIVSVDWGDSNVSNSGQTGTKRVGIEKTQTTTLGHSYYLNGKYTIKFKVVDDDTGLSASYSVPVTVIYAQPVKPLPLALSSISQSQGPVGTQIVLNGSGFQASPVSIHFGDSVVSATPQNYGTALYFNVAPGTSAGSYAIYVSNELGQITKTVYFKVTGL